jgi:nicotinamide-nucleotide amidase
MTRAGILTIGSEILSGTVVDTNTAYLARGLTDLEFEVNAHISVGDEPGEICRALDILLSKCDLVVVTGGLGPTFDDITKRTLAAFFHRALVLNRNLLQRIRVYFRRRGRPMHPAARTQVFFPERSKIFVNDYGVAPGFGLQAGAKWVIALPGVPSEMEGMFRDKVTPFLAKAFPRRDHADTLSAKIILTSEVEVLERLGEQFPPKDSSIRCGIYPHSGELLLKMRFSSPTVRENQRKRAHWKKIIARRAGKNLVGFTEDPFEKIVGDLLRRRRETLGVCESLTGGLIAKRLTDIPGASRFLRGAAVSYADISKAFFAGVRPHTLKRHTAVSAPVAREAAQGVREKLGTTWGIAATGLAGPTANSGRHPVGTVFVGLASRGGSEVRQYRFFGNREKIRWLASQAALALLWKHLARG